MALAQRVSFASLVASLAALSMLVVACGGGAEKQSNTTTTVELLNPDDVEPTLEESSSKVTRMGGLFAELGNNVDIAGADCNAVATAISDWSTTHRTEVTELNKALAAMPEAHVKELSPQLDAALRRAALKVKDGNDRCPGHEGVFDAISGLPR